ncbi:MAG: histidine kinase [Verrucomicrobiota bacterium]|nr:histidine kinase [Verrucomicrobiota bacterium]
MTPTIEEMRALLVRQWQQREDDRRWLSQEIHSTLAQDLTVLSMELSLLERRMSVLAGKLDNSDLETMRTKLGELSALVRKTVEWTRWVKNRLRPKVLDEFGLPAAVKWRGEEFERETGIICMVLVEPETIEIPPALGTDCFRIVEELFGHASQVGNVKHVEVRLVARGNNLMIEFKYDGSDVCGDASGLRNSLWVAEISERAAFWGGAVALGRTQGHGTTVTVTMPIGKVAAARASSGA